MSIRYFSGFFSFRFYSSQLSIDSMFGRLLLLYLVGETIPTGIPVSQRSLAGTPPNERHSIQQDHNATIGDIFNALVLISEEIVTNQMRSSGTSQPVPTVRVTLTIYLFIYFIFKSGTYTISVSYISRASANYNQVDILIDNVMQSSILFAIIQ